MFESESSTESEFEKFTTLTSMLERTRPGVTLFGMTATFCWTQNFIRIWAAALECRLAISTTTSSSSIGIGSKVLTNTKKVTIKLEIRTRKEKDLS